MAKKSKHCRADDPSPDVILGLLLTAVGAAASVNQVVISLQDRAAAALRHRKSNRQRISAWAASVRVLYAEVVALDEFANRTFRKHGSEFKVGGKLYLTESDRQVLTEITRRIFHLASKCFEASARLQEALLNDVAGFTRYAENELSHSLQRLQSVSEETLRQSRRPWEFRDGLEMIFEVRKSLQSLAELEPLLLKFMDN